METERGQHSSARSRLLRRLPVLLLVALGVFLWKSDLFPQDRKLVWSLRGTFSQLEEIDLQLWNEAGELIRREQRFNVLEREIPISVPLKPGRYRAEAFIRRSGSDTARYSLWLEIEKQTEVQIPVEVRPR